MANYLIPLLVWIAVFATGTRAQNPSCPTSNPYSDCRCYQSSPGFSIYCRSGYNVDTPEEIRSAVEYYKSYGPVVSLYVHDIRQSSFSYVPDNFLAGNIMQNVTFECSHSASSGGFSVNSGLLSLSINAFKDGTGICGLKGNLTFTNCNLRQFYSDTLKDCLFLEKVAFMNSHVESLLYIPTLESLKNLTVYYSTPWAGASQRGLSRMTLAPGASLPNLRYLDLSGNSLGNDYMEFVPQLTAIEEMHLEGNNFTVVPDLTNAFYLQNYTMELSAVSNSNVSILLPNPRTQVGFLDATFISYNPSFEPINYNVMSLEGMFRQDNVINLLMEMTKFNEDAFLSPLLSSNSLTINLNPRSRFECGCSIAWLVRDNPILLKQVNNGYCADGRPFESIPPAEVACCPTNSLHRRIHHLQRENENLKIALHQLQSKAQND